MNFCKLFKKESVSSDKHEPYFRSCLSAKHKTVYDKMFICMNDCADETQISTVSQKDLKIIFESILKDHPIIFYTTKFQWSTSSASNEITFMPKYLYDKSTIKNYKEKILKYLKIFDKVKDKSDYEKELFVHDHCLENFKYDYNFNESSYSAHGLVLYNTAVCEGIAEFVKLALDYLGVRCLVVYGEGKDPTGKTSVESHAWNIVEIDGKTYHLDVTFDMTIKNKINRYDYFNLCDTDIKKEHIIKDKAPACNTCNADYLTKNSMVVNNLSDFETYIEKELKSGKKHIMFKLLNHKFQDSLVDNLQKLAMQKYLDIFGGSVSIQTGYNPSQMVFEIEYQKQTQAVKSLSGR